MPTKKTSCDRVQKAVAGPTPEDIVKSIRVEYGLPHPKPREAGLPDAAPTSTASNPKKVTS